ncbi:IscS subfamily cysteine desulfurase [Paenibacillus massiliensis]|uniref:IscS subfamily cysteine desulfurase n=1 Tax=Paenibacillus massiliensis TaxID=225917 RepID=UPI0004119E49|nr:IscS subfamily cysteine desulfurase [Paenibacillus massiliensis]
MTYLDFAATTPMSEEALETYRTVSLEVYGNTRSLHDTGGQAQHIVDYCRAKLGELLCAETEGIYFTSGGTESNHLIIQSLLQGLPPSRRHFITTSVEHASIRSLTQYLTGIGYEVTIVEPDRRGLITPEALMSHLRDNTGLVSIQHANSETGIVQRLADLSSLLKKRGIILHTDAVQSFGKIPINVQELGVDALSISSHKIYGPKGVGAAYIRPGVHWRPVFPGTNHEGGFRPGTVNTPGIAAFVTAAEALMPHIEQLGRDYEELRTLFFRKARERGLPLQPVAHPAHTESNAGDNTDDNAGSNYAADQRHGPEHGNQLEHELKHKDEQKHEHEYELESEHDLQHESIHAPANPGMNNSLTEQTLLVVTSPVPLVPHIAGFYYYGYEAQYVMLECNRKGICVSTGSACASGYQEPSPSITALAGPPENALHFLRMSMGRTTTAEDIYRLLDVLEDLTNRRGNRPERGSTID